jgi:hypothetical protein
MCKSINKIISIIFVIYFFIQCQLRINGYRQELWFRISIIIIPIVYLLCVFLNRKDQSYKLYLLGGSAILLYNLSLLI